MFIRYGKDYWCYLGNINTLSAEARLKCMAYYNEDEDDKTLGEQVLADKKVAQKAKDAAPRVACSSSEK